MYNMIDLIACYDRQLAEIGSIVEESIGIERKPIQLIAKVLPIIEHHICTSFGASEEFYRGVNNKQVGMGQGHITSVNIYRDTSNLIIKPIEEMQIRIRMKGGILEIVEDETAVAFIDDTDFIMEGEECQRKMQTILDTYIILFQVTGGAMNS